MEVDTGYQQPVGATFTDFIAVVGWMCRRRPLAAQHLAKCSPDTRRSRHALGVSPPDLQETTGFRADAAVCAQCQALERWIAMDSALCVLPGSHNSSAEVKSDQSVQKCTQPRSRRFHSCHSTSVQPTAVPESPAAQDLRTVTGHSSAGPATVA